MAEAKYPNPPPPYSSEPQQPYYSQPVTNQPRTIVIASNPAVILVNNLGPVPTSCHCNVCNRQVITFIQHVTSGRTHLCAGILCLLGCWPCVWIPYCTDACKKVHHYCPQCNTYMGSNS